eukprot:TRINITY_DN4381_c0_g1_i1.p1 TRINITY_DN4381_c0_g1~~TRINITY_DN4381_c0_g1_i1.p1  ORF type:complete len:112 (+),score=31.76 TRINITY_DN4381_c0_g1_i1:67-402(+)
MSDYSNVVRGKLKLKKTAANAIDREGKKKKKKQAAILEEEKEKELQSLTHSEENVDRRTKAERRFEEAVAKREAELIEKKITKTHRQKIEEFNQYLANMSEHYDIPKVGPG